MCWRKGVSFAGIYTVINKQQATHLDLILQILVDDTVNIRSVDEINENLLKNESHDYCLSLYYILSEHYPKLLYPESNITPSGFWATDYVKAFLHNGGFTSLYDSAAEKLEAEKEKEKLNTEKLKFDVKNAKRMHKTYWWTFTISILGFLLALGKIIYDIIIKK